MGGEHNSMNNHYAKDGVNRDTGKAAHAAVGGGASKDNCYPPPHKFPKYTFSMGHI